jgi:ABC-type uncharacterized transport system permease subunit
LAELLFWPALLAYGEAAIAYASPRTSRAATWGVRVGWLLQTALLAAQAARDDGFPWASRGGSLNLFVWLVVGAYLIWGCRARYRLLGALVLPLAVVLLVAARAAGGTGAGDASRYGNLFLVLHVGLVLAAFAGFTLAAALSALYLWQERRLKRKEAGILRLPMPPLASLDTLAARTIAVALPALALGIAVGLARLRSTGDSVDATMAVAGATVALYGAYVGLRWGAGWAGRRTAYLALAGFVLVLLTRLALPHL